MMPTGTADLFPRLRHPDDAPALQIDGTRLSYRQLAAAARHHAARLREQGLGPGDRVAVWTDHGPHAIVAIVGNALAGVVSVPLNPAIGERELAHVLRDAAPRRVQAAALAARAEQTPTLPVDAVAIETHDPASVGDWPGHAVDDRPLLVVYTSGTTGAPKGAVLTARNAASNIDALASAWQWSAHDALVHALPIFHVHGLVLGVVGTLRVGSSLRWLARFDPEAVGAALAGGATMLFGVPTMYHRIADALERDRALARAYQSARLLVSGSAPLALREHTRIAGTTGRSVIERYGLTETLINTAVRSDEPARPGYVGKALAGIEIRLCDDARRALAVRDDATLGEVCVRGPNVFAGYLNRPDATAAVRDDDGWFYTGDLATMAPDGAVRIVGRRATDLIKTAGYKVGAGEVEAALLEHPLVREAAVIGVPDDDLGEKIVAYVVPRDASAPAAEAELAAHVASLLAAHKRPRLVRSIAELPRNAMGKVLKAELRARENR